MNLIEKNWNEILEHVRKEHELSDVSFETWLLPLKVHSAENHVVKIIVPMGEQMITYLNSKFKTPIFVAIAEFTGEKKRQNRKLPQTSTRKTARPFRARQILTTENQISIRSLLLTPS